MPDEDNFGGSLVLEFRKMMTSHASHENYDECRLSD